MNRKQIIAQLIERISVMEHNDYLLPQTWSDIIDMTFHDWSYKTYKGDGRGKDRYINIHIVKAGADVLVIEFRSNDSIYLIQPESTKMYKISDALDFINAIYEEKHSFENHNEGARKLRKDIREKQQRVKDYLKEIEGLKKQLTGLKELSKSN